MRPHPGARSIQESNNPKIHSSNQLFFLTMPGQAQITSVEALERFRSDLIVFLTQIKPVVDEVGGEVVRMKFWLENDQRPVLENQARQRRRRLEEAQAEVFNARLSKLQDSSALQQMAAQKARRAVEETEQKLGAVKKWDRDLENRTDPFVKQVAQLQGFLANDMARAVAYLTQIIQSLEAYRDVAPSGTPAPNLPPADEPPPTP